MINLFNTQIESLSIHKIGNKARQEGVSMSEEQTKISDEISPLLKEYFFKPFRDKEESYYQFAHDVDLDYNELYNLASEVFSNPNKTHDVSKQIARYLYDQSSHPHIKNGELYVCYLTNVLLDNEKVDAIGIFKSEIKADFLQFEEKESYLEVILQQGINLTKLDKGCIIFNTEKELGYKILSVDQNRYDTRYWLESFLNVDYFKDENYNTKKYLKFIQEFSKEVVLPAEDKKEEVVFTNKSFNYFAERDEFEENEFINEVIENPDLKAEFKNYKANQGQKYSVEDLSNFSISNTAVSDARKKYKSTITLDTNVQIKMNFVNQESADKIIEKGWDEERQMYYYLIYYNKETK